MDVTKWLRLSIFNLLIVALLGAVLRYKIAFSLSFIDQRNLLHGHSHFAFSGWVSQALMALIISRLSAYVSSANFKRYNRIMWANAICAYGMLISFPISGYGLFSIIFSTAALFVSYVFMAYVWKDIARATQKNISFVWFKAATLFNTLSSVGAYSLAYMMATKNAQQHVYLGSVYFFLHFQYNGWFSFTILGLLTEKFQHARILTRHLRAIFWLFALSCAPAYFLSALWMHIPRIVHALVVVSAVAQAIGWFWLLSLFIKKRKYFSFTLSAFPYHIVVLSLVAFSIKFLLQLGSTIPSLSKLAFGFRPIVIGYLHLVLLGAVSLFIIGYTLYIGVLELGRNTRAGIVIFVCGVILNELTLMIQGIAAMGYVSIPHINEVLFIVSSIIASGLVVLNIHRRKREAPGLENSHFTANAQSS